MYYINEDGETYMNMPYMYIEIYIKIHMCVSKLMRMPRCSALDCDVPAIFVTKLCPLCTAYIVLHTLQGVAYFLSNFYVNHPIATAFSENICTFIVIVFTKIKLLCFIITRQGAWPKFKINVIRISTFLLFILLVFLACIAS